VKVTRAFSRRRISVGLLGLLVLVLGGWLVKDVAVGHSDPGLGSLPGADSGMRVAPLSSLPPEVERTLELIERGGPFPYPDTDGATFGNRENVLPEKPPGYYREYTVQSPGSQGRGPRRLVTGERDEVYYTRDHDASFVVVDPKR
jgi:guanyl-specific ribonuclease Sa